MATIESATIRKSGTFLRWVPLLVLLLGLVAAGYATWCFIQKARVERRYEELAEIARQAKEALRVEMDKQGSPFGGLINMMGFSSPETRELSAQMITLEERAFPTVGVAIALLGISVAWLLVRRIERRRGAAEAPVPVRLPWVSLLLVVAVLTAAAFLWHFRMGHVDLVLLIFFAGVLLPTLFLKASAGRLCRTRPSLALLLFFLTVGADLAFVLLPLYLQSSEPLCVLLGLQDTSLHENWYLGTAMVAWVIAIAVFGLAARLGWKRSPQLS